mmetsp:Transcript_5886/g.16797  ORF Transcript_5886/g.16797 Transcript_5886/m.16797 type:complete len:230 (+) Transcript_5886:396-1085(+)
MRRGKSIGAAAAIVKETKWMQNGMTGRAGVREASGSVIELTRCLAKRSPLATEMTESRAAAAENVGCPEVIAGTKTTASGGPAIKGHGPGSAAPLATAPLPATALPLAAATGTTGGAAAAGTGAAAAPRSAAPAAPPHPAMRRTAWAATCPASARSRRARECGRWRRRATAAVAATTTLTLRCGRASPSRRRRSSGRCRNSSCGRDSWCCSSRRPLPSRLPPRRSVRCT